MKIARLAVDNGYKRMGFGKMLIQFSSYIAQKIQSQSGLVFITLDCYAHRLSFYESIGFEKNAIQPVQRDYDSPISMRILLDKYLESVEDEL
jgi:ribosomal protein S18 acetylase RimI-like enzyme